MLKKKSDNIHSYIEQEKSRDYLGEQIWYIELKSNKKLQRRPYDYVKRDGKMHQLYWLAEGNFFFT